MSLQGLMMTAPPLAVGAMAEYTFRPELQKRFTVLSRFGDPVVLHKVAQGRIYLPRAVCPVAGEDKRVDGQPYDFACTAKPRDAEQERIVSETVGFLSQGQSGILQASTGFGKTVVSMMVTAALKRPTLIVVPKEDLLQQWVEAVTKFLPGVPYGIIQQDRCDVEGKPLAIAMVHSLIKPGRYPSYAYDQWGLMITDETHRIAADSFSEVCWMVPARLRLGLSATPDRQDGKEVVIYSHIGPVRAKSKHLSLKPKVLVYRTNWACPRVVRTVNGKKKVVPLPHTPGKVGHIVKHMANDAARRQLIGELAYTAWQKKRKLMLFSDLLDLLDTFKVELNAMGVPMRDMGLYVGGMKKADLDHSKGKPIILATYQMAKEGTDIPWLDACILATPKSEIEQIIGRILREYPGKPQPVVFDIVDEDSPVFSGYANKRLWFYKRIGADVKFM